jgi:outer membrane protein TolC
MDHTLKRTLQNTCTTALLILCTLLPASAQKLSTEGSLSLKDCLQYALANNSDIKGASNQKEMASKRVWEAAASGLPQVNISGSLVNNLELPVQVLPADLLGGPTGQEVAVKFGTKYNCTVTGQVTQMLFNGSYWLGLSAANTSNRYYEQSSENVTQDVEYNLATAYYQILAVQKQIQLLSQNRLLVEQSLNDAKLRYENGKAKRVDVDRLNVGYNNIQYQIKKATEGLTQAYNNLKFRMGMPIDASISLADSLRFANDTVIITESAKLGYADSSRPSFEDRPDYRMLQTALELRELDRRNQIAQYLPTISAFGSYSYQAQRHHFDIFDGGKDWYKYYYVGLQFQIPIFNGGQTHARVQEASIAVDQIKEEIRKAELGINLELSNASFKYNTTIDNIRTETLNVRLAQEVYRVTQLEFQQGVSTTIDLVDAETRLREAQTNFVNAILDLHIARLDLEKSRGTLGHYLSTLN